MTRNEYMNQLRAKLYKRVPESDINEVLAYYEEYFNEAGQAREEEAAAELGEPVVVAAQIVSERALVVAAEQPQSVKKGFSALWIVIVGLFAAPIALPIAAFLVMAFFGLLVAIVGVIIGLFIALIGLGAAGLFSIILGLSLLTSSLGTTLVFLGIGLVLVGIVLLFLPALFWITNTVFRALAAVVNKTAGWFRKRFNKKKDSGNGDGEDDGLKSFEDDEDAPSESTFTSFVNQAQGALSDAFATVQAPRCPGLGRRDR